MEALKRNRKPVRASFTKAFNDMVEELGLETPNIETVKAKISSLDRLFNELGNWDTQILNCEYKTDDEYDSEFTRIEEYREKMDVARVKVETFFSSQTAPTDYSASVDALPILNKRKLKLPKIELKQFGGDIKDWLTFWTQFKRIHDDKLIEKEDKFHYLFQATAQGTRARDIVESFPATAANYDNVIECLKNRFGKEELLIEFYVREMLGLVIENATDQKRKLNIAQLYDKLESYLRALESIGMTSDKYAAMLFPLVESCIPEELLRVWLRNYAAISSQESSYCDKLKQLLTFLKNEVEGEQRISLAKSGFKLFESRLPKERKCKEKLSVPTANDLFSGEKRTSRRNENICIFCEKHHESKDCFSAPKMALNQKHDLIKDKRGCFICLKVGHRAKQCKTYLSCLICSKRHWAVVCPELTANQKNEVKESTEEDKNVTLANSCSTEVVLLQTLLVNIDSNGKKQTVRALIDTGSQRSYILKETAERTGCKPVGSETLVHSLFGGVTSKKEVHKCYSLSISSLDNSYSWKVKLLGQPKICGFVPSLPPGPWMKEIMQKNIRVTDSGSKNLPIEILLGADTIGNIFTGKIQKLDSGLMAVHTLLGWVVMGKLNECVSALSISTMITSMLIHSNNLENLWKLDTLGITDPSETKSRQELENAVLDHFHKTLRKDNEERYEVSLPWIGDRGNLPSNRDIAERRLISSTKKLKYEDKLEDYNAVIGDWLKSGIIEEVSENEARGHVHYLPHRAVFKENSTTAVRPVFDASCKQKNFPSLNDCLAKGPNLLELVPTILFNFREKKVGIISDIRKAFLQVSVNENDRDVLRFLWWNDLEHQQIKEFRHCRVVFGLNCSPFLLGAVINFHLRQYEPPHKHIAEKLRSSFYVDNCVTSVDSSEEAKLFIAKATEMMAQANFDLRGWHQSEIGIMNENTQPLKVMGLLWDKHEDTLFCDVQYISLGNLPVSRRNVLSITQRVFDPVGFSSPVTLLPKLYLQKSWEERLSWDSELPVDTKKKFLKWLSELPLLSLVKIPRQVTMNNCSSYSLHTFCDASKNSYAAVVYLRSENEKQVKVQLLQAKSRVAPLKRPTMPRLELLACCIGARLHSFVKENLQIEISKEYFWSDSSTALCWIQRNEVWGTFVNNRVKEIRNLSKTKDWRHVPGTDNPADLPSRGCSVTKLIQSRWWEGPLWLTKPEDLWPKSNPIQDETEITAEKRRMILTSLSCSTNACSWITAYFSKYNKIVRMVAWMYRFIRNARGISREREIGELKVSELSAAEKIIIKLVQQEVFNSEDIKKLKSISVFKDEEGLLRVRTKLAERKDERDFICPMLLPNKHELVNSLIREVHLKMIHAGTNSLMSKLRETFWILRARKTIRKVVSSCLRCKRYEAKRLESIPVALPENRVRDASVFEITGVDLAGPLILKGREKAWIVLFSCAVYRAIHLELITSLSTQSFLLGFRRFIARRGRPKVVYSDNGTNFIGTNNLLKSIDWKAIEVEASVRRIQWYFNPPAAPWWGGFWERMIQMVKKLLRRVLGQSSLNYEELTTVLYDCEAVVNSRPLTYVSEDSDDLIPLTPAMFLGENMEVGVPDLDNIDQVNLDKRLRRQQELRNILRKRFRSEYLSQLVLRRSKVKKYHNVKVGDVVLVENEGKRRMFWPMAKVIEVYPGKDGNIRVVRIKTSSGEMIRPVQRIFPLEISSPEDYKADEQC